MCTQTAPLLLKGPREPVGPYPVLNQSIGVLLDHVAARGNSLVVGSLVPKGDRRPLEVVGVGHLWTLALGGL